ncbi:uncharacterized protein UHOR_13022 [Ustilago hordei]|uniref:Uncharacterized protein n=2 Tax=Ustilago hordei TaxID=120017 RepID=I2FMQ0_USTHO|nr:uncharacterized protein UHOR_13022 [Ustilago hordei]
MIAGEVYGTPNTPKEGSLLKFAITGDNKQVISPLSIMIECVSELYYGMHDLGPFPSQIKLGKAMQTRVNNFLANKEWNTGHILAFKIEGPFEQQHHTKTEMPGPIRVDINKMDMLFRADTPISDVSSTTCCHLISCDATPGPTPELSAITNHHLKTLSSLNERMQWDEHNLLDPRVVSVHAWRHNIFAMLSIIPFA